MFYLQYVTILMEIFYLHLLTRVTSNKSFFSIHIELLSFKRGDFDRQELLDIFEKGVCDVEINFNITCL